MEDPTDELLMSLSKITDHSFVNGNGHGHLYAGDTALSKRAEQAYLNELHELSNGADTNENRTHSSPIAVCGMALRLPGGLMTPSQFWDFILSKGDARSRVPESRYNISSYQSARGKPGTIKSEHGYFLDDSEVGLGSLDTSFFSMTKGELERLDPQQRQLLEVVRECFESAGEVGWRGQNIGCYVGNFGEDWCEMSCKDDQNHGLYRITGYGDFVLANRISYEYDLKGPSLTIRTGCSAALIGLHEACVAIERGDCSAAIVAGSSLLLAPGFTAALTEQGVLSPEGSCKTFDADADGYARGEAINAVFIKPLHAALKDGNPIRAVIRSTSTNCDGKTAGISNPSSESHEAMIRRAYSQADIHDFSLTAFVECHGTGTAIGDPLEAHAVANVFGEKGVYIGSVKPNVGHSEGASGITSLIKVVLALENKTIPPNIKFNKPNPKIPFKSRRLQVPIEAQKWPLDRCERASVNSFGIGGANVHVIVDSASSFTSRRSGLVKPPSDEPKLLLYSANTADSLRRQVLNQNRYLEANPDSLSHLAYTLGVRREHLPHRSFALAAHAVDPKAAPFTRIPTIQPDIVMVFTGQGAQWPLMGKELIDSNSTFRATIMYLDEILQKLPSPPVWSIQEELSKPAELSELHLAALSQPLCSAVQVALVDTFAAVGIKPSAVVGHSSGEMAAAYAAGALTAAEAIKAAYFRGLVSKSATRPGAMAAIGMSSDETMNYLVDGVIIACENSLNSVTISGDLDAVQSVVKSIKSHREDVLARLLKVDQAYHSHHMKALGESYLELAHQHVTGRPPSQSVIFFSSVSGKQMQKSPDARYWRSNLESPVMFRKAVSNLLEHVGKDNKLFLEIGPHSALAGPIRQILAEVSISAPYVPAMLRYQDCNFSLLSCLGQLWMQSIPIKLSVLTPQEDHHVLTDLPLYPWHHENGYWYESRLSSEWRLRKFPHHDILGVRLSESTDSEPAWRNILHLENAPWIRDHKVKNDIIFPCAGYIAAAGEAVRQLTVGSMNSDVVFSGYAMRHVIVSTALVLNDGKPTETITSFKKAALTESLDSAWWNFTISSHNGHSWIKHCSGQCKALQNPPKDTSTTEPLRRKVDSKKWYEVMRRVGLEYGTRFQGLNDIYSATTENTATATTVSTVPLETTEYSLHPTTIDFFLQLHSVAVARGITRQFKTMVVPTNIEEIEVYNSSPEISMTVKASSTPKGAITGGGLGYGKSGEVVLRMKGVKLSPLEDEADPRSIDPHAAARIHWAPDIHFLDIGDSSLIKACVDRETYAAQLDELTALLVAQTVEDLSGLSTTLPHMLKYQQWLQNYTRTYSPSKSSANTSDQIKNVFDSISKTNAAAAAVAMMKIFENVKALYTGNVDALEILMDDGTLTHLYDFTDKIDRTSFLHLLAHHQPNLRILEVGAGTGGTTSAILSDLTRNGQPLYLKYMFTDISSGFFPAARTRLGSYQNLEFKALDIAKDPVEQGFEAEAYDLIFATNVLHATPSLHETLTNVRKLMAPNGKLVLQELCSQSKWINYIMGVFPGWWLGKPDGRPEEPYVSPTRWGEELRKMGFAPLEASVLDAKEPYHHNAVIVATPKKGWVAPPKVSIICEQHNERTRLLCDAFESKGQEVIWCDLYHSPLPGQDCIVVLDDSESFFANISDEKWAALKSLISKLDDAGILWLTSPSQVSSLDASFAPVLGIARVIRGEMSVDFATCEVDDLESCLGQVTEIFAKFQRRRLDRTAVPDYEYVVKNSTVYVGRYHPFSISQELANISRGEAADGNGVTLSIGKHGQLSSLQWRYDTPSGLGDEEVEIEIQAAGMNFKDVLIAMGIIDADNAGLGIEGAGIVRKVGGNVREFQPGDRVATITAGCFSSTTVVSEKLCVKIPPQLSFDDGATMPCVYGTVIYSLIDVARLEKGQSILIHSACGGVGIAAIQLSKMLGAEIYCTVGNEEKVQYLMKTFEIPKYRIFNSRDTSFLSDLLAVTKGNGVDVVLNSLSGELLHASWQCVADFGKLIEIGKRDLLGRGRLDMEPFLRNRSYCCVDLDQVCQMRPQIGKRLLKMMIEFYDAGHIQPILPVKTFAATNIQDCFRYMQKGQHIGKIIVNMKSLEHTTVSVSSAPTLKLDSNSSYLLVGGLGGLGKSVSLWLAENGARHLVFLSRSAGKSDSDKDFFADLESQGVVVSVIEGSVTNTADVEKAVRASKIRLAGIFQMSMVLRDQSFSAMTYEEFQAALQPKVDGTINIHNATAGLELDFFVLFSSISGIVGQPGQANYAAANAFLDAFVQYRQSKGLVCSAIDIGALEDAGYVANNSTLLSRLKAQGAYLLREKELFDALQLAILQSKPKPQTGIDNVSKPKDRLKDGYCNASTFVLGLRPTTSLNETSNRTFWRKDRRIATYLNSSDASNTSGYSPGDSSRSELTAFLLSARADPFLLAQDSSATLLAEEIGKTLFDFLLKPVDEADGKIDVSLTLQSLGMDSLVAIEMRSWWRRTFGFDISVLELMGMGTLEAMGKSAADGLRGLLGGNVEEMDPGYLANKAP